MNGLLDFLQGASNAAASNVSGPVDLIGMGLRKLGVPVPQNALLSSQWMEERGLTRKPKNALAAMAGETVGLLSPVVAAAKAPQIARGLLQVGENAAAPATMNAGMASGQRGMIDVKALKDKFPGVDFALRQSDDKAFLDRVIVPKEAREQGLGTEFMQALVRAADDDAARLGLTPSADFGGSKSRLEAFYRRFGFVPNKGRNRDFELMAAMIRQPNEK